MGSTAHRRGEGPEEGDQLLPHRFEGDRLLALLQPSECEKQEKRLVGGSPITTLIHAQLPDGGEKVEGGSRHGEPPPIL